MRIRKTNLLIFLLSGLAALLLFFGIGISLPAPLEADAVTVSTLPAGLEDLFTDYTRTKLNEQYSDAETLEGLKERYRGNDSALDILSRAEQVLRGEVRFQPDRTFSTEGDAFRKIEQYGDTTVYSNSNLKWKYDSSDLLITGVYGVTGDEFTVYVDAAPGCYLPKIVLTEQHGQYRYYRETVYLSRGANTFTFGDFGHSGGTAGPVYLSNPYLPDRQPGGVRLYIEGGNSYPVFKKDGDVTAFLGELKTYEEKRQTSGGSIPDLAELSTDFAFFTTTSSSLYEAYIARCSADPQENMELWGKIFTQLYEFNGILTSENSPYGTYDARIKGVRLNFRYMQPIANSGAYATNGHIGVYQDHLPWLADCKANVGDYIVFSLGHEVGHVLDTDGRNLDETTNNMSAAFAYFAVRGKSPNETYQPYGESLELLARDGAQTADAYRNIHILYEGLRGIYDRNYMVWWYLESCFPGYWARLNALYRSGEGSALSDWNERLVYLSSLATGVDLGNYFDRWGMFVKGSPFSLKNASERYRALMEEAASARGVKKVFDRFYYADEAEYTFIRTHEPAEYRGSITSVSVKRAGTGHIVSVAGKQDPAHLGYEIRVSTDGKTYSIAGFTRSALFEDEFSYPTEPYYVAVAVNRFFAIGEESTPVKAGDAEVVSGVCRVGNERFDSLKEGLDNVPADGTVYLLADCSLEGVDRYSPLTIEVDASVHENVRLSNTGKSFLLKTDAQVTLRGKEDAHIIIDNGPINRYYPPIFVGSGALIAEYTEFTGISSNLGGAIYALSADLTLENCVFDNCTGSKADFINMEGRHTLTLKDCAFRGTGRDIRLAGGATLMLSGSVPALKLILDGEVSVRTDFDPTPEQLENLDGGDALRATANGREIEFVSAKRRLTFHTSGGSIVYEAGESFVFGQEHADGLLGGKEYIETYIDWDTYEEYHVGDTIHPTKDMRFRTRTANKARVLLRFKSGEKECFLAPSERLYLPRTDGTEAIAYWLADGETLPAGGSCGVAARLVPIYFGCLYYECRQGGEVVSSGYANFGETVSLPEPGEGFASWTLCGKTVRGEVPLTGDAVFVAVREETPDLAGAQLSLVGAPPVYNGEAQMPEVLLTLGGEVLTEGYELVYSNNVNAGEFSVTARATDVSRLTGSVTAVFSILPRDISAEAAITPPPDTVYSGAEQKLVPAVRWQERLLGESEVAFSWQGDLKNAGTVIIQAVFSGNFTGSATTEYRILKADHPPLPDAARKAGDAKLLSELSLPEGWEWEDGTLSVVGEGTLTAKAVYRGADADNYLHLETSVTVERSAPVEPDDPDKPVEPDQPDKPVEPDEPVEPDQPDKPVEPDNPDEPEEPIEPVAPDEQDTGCGGVTALPLFLPLAALFPIKRKKQSHGEPRSF